MESGEKERLKDHLRMRLKECGWEDQLRLHAKDVVREKGLERIKLEELTKVYIIKYHPLQEKPF